MFYIEIKVGNRFNGRYLTFYVEISVKGGRYYELVFNIDIIPLYKLLLWNFLRHFIKINNQYSYLSLILSVPYSKGRMCTEEAV